MTADVSALFPDKLHDMNRYLYKLILMGQYPRITMKKNDTEFAGIDLEIMKTIAASQNAGMKLKLGVNLFSLKNNDLFVQILLHQLADLTFNPIFSSYHYHYRDFINTYDQNGYCAIVPIPPPLTFFIFSSHLSMNYRGHS